jgi:hypothetical protein
MSIEFKLVRGNPLLDPNQYLGRVIARTANLEQLVDRIMEHGSSVCRSDVLSVLEDYFQALENMLVEGWTVITPAAVYRVTIQGVFEGRLDEFDPARHQVTVQVTAGRRLRRCIHGQARVERRLGTPPVPQVAEYLDVTTGAVHSAVTPGGQGMIVGERIKFDPSDAAQGIFFVAADQTATRVQSVAWNGVRKHIFLVPALAPGEYVLQVRASFIGNGDVRTGALLDKLTVALARRAWEALQLYRSMAAPGQEPLGPRHAAYGKGSTSPTKRCPWPETVSM